MPRKTTLMNKGYSKGLEEKAKEFKKAGGSIYS